MQLVRKSKRPAPGRERLQRSARAVVAGFAVDSASARQMILEAVEAGARHCGPLAVSTLCAMLSGKYAPAADEGARTAAERVFGALPLSSSPMGRGGDPFAKQGEVRGYGLSGEVPTPSPSQPAAGPLPLPTGEGK